MHLQQISPPQRFPSGNSHPVAILKFTPNELAARFGIIFTEDHDDLDYFQFAALNDSEIGQILLLRYRNNPNPGTEVLVDSDVDVTQALSVLMRALGLTASDLTWTA